MPEQGRVTFEIGIEDVEETKALVIKECVHQDAMSEVVPKDIAEVHAYVQELGLGFHGPPLCICPFRTTTGS